MELRVINNPEWQKQNGISLLAAADGKEPFLLTMSDHLFDESIVNLLVSSVASERLHLAIDRKLDSILDPDDAMKVETRGDQIVAIGKNLTTYDAIDTGLFVCPPEMFDYLEKAKRNGDCSLADGVRSMAAARQNTRDRYWTGLVAGYRYPGNASARDQRVGRQNFAPVRIGNERYRPLGRGLLSPVIKLTGEGARPASKVSFQDL